MRRNINLNIDDTDLWIKFKEGDLNAFNDIYKQYYRLLYHYGYNILSEKEFIKDCLQSFFFELWRDKDHLGDVKTIKFYLLISFRRKVLYNLKKKRKAVLNEKDYVANVVEIHSKSYEQIIITQQQDLINRHFITNLVQILPPQQKEAIYLKYYQNLSYQEIMDIMSLKYQTVRDLIYKALKSLRKHAVAHKIAL